MTTSRRPGVRPGEKMSEAQAREAVRLGVERLEEPPAGVRPRAAPGTRAHIELEHAIDLIEAAQATRGIAANDAAHER